MIFRHLTRSSLLRLFSDIVCVLILCSPVPRAEAEEAGIYRAILIGEQTYSSETLKDRPGAIHSAQGMADMLSSLGLGYENTVLSDAGAADIASVMEKAAASGSEKDTTVFYINCHGTFTSGVFRFILSDGSYMTGYELSRLIKAIKGSVLIIADCCASGSITSDASDTDASCVDAFSMSNLLGLYDVSRYHVICSSLTGENSYRLSFDGGTDDSSIGTVLSYSLCEGAGWDYVSGKKGARRADLDFDGAVTFEEMAVFLKYRVDYRLSGTSCTQTVSVYPENDGTVLFPKAEN